MAYIMSNRMISLPPQLTKKLLLLSMFILLSACSSVTEVGEIGPKKLKVYAVSHNDFLSASRMLIVLNDKGDLGASAGGTVTGAGVVTVQAATSLAASGAVLYGAKAIQHGLENAKIKGIPSTVNLNAKADINATGEFIHHND
jgi:hypothetical protein